jgi:hypothetical protein
LDFAYLWIPIFSQSVYNTEKQLIEVCNCIGFRLGGPRFQVLAFFLFCQCVGG